MPIVQVNLCCSSSSFLKWFEIISCSIIIGLIRPAVDPNQWEGYTFILIEAIICLCIALLLLMIWFAGMHRSLYECPWNRVEVLANTLAVLLNMAACGIAIFDAERLWNHRSGRINVMGDPEWRNRMTAIAAFTAANVLAFLFSCAHSHTVGQGYWIISTTRYWLLLIDYWFIVFRWNDIIKSEKMWENLNLLGLNYMLCSSFHCDCLYVPKTFWRGVVHYVSCLLSQLCW